MVVNVEYNGTVPLVRYVPSSRPKAKKPTSLDDNCYVDWRQNSSATPTDVTLKWLVVIGSSLGLGYCASIIDLTSIWLNDFKKGLCISSTNNWSLSSPYSTCPRDNWRSWSEILFNAQSLAAHILFDFPLYVIFSILFAVVAAWVTIKVPYIRLSGLPEIKAIVSGLNYNVDEYLGLKTLLYKIPGLILVVSSGLWLGKEGPLVHVACAISNILYNAIIGHAKGNEYLRREIISASAATGISVAFNAPIGGVLFMLEFLQSYWPPMRLMWYSFVSSIVAVVVVNSFKIFTDGQNFMEKDLFQIEFGNFSWLFMEFIPFAILGAIGGLYGFLFIKLNTWFTKNGVRSHFQSKVCQLLHLSHDYGKIVEVLAVLCLTIVSTYPFPIARLPLHVYVKILFTDCPENLSETESLNFICKPSNGATMMQLLFIFVTGFCLSSYTFGVYLPGGVLMPSLALGATIGRFIGLLSQVIQNKFQMGIAECTKNSCLVSPSSYAVVGAASFMTGITKLTMCVVVLIFELTGAVSYVLPIMISVMISKFVNDYLISTNIYDQWLKDEFNKIEMHLVNSGKGSGICDFTTSTQNVQIKLPDVTLSKVFIPTTQVKCIEVCKLHNSTEFQSFINDDTHEGYPLIGSYENPISLGYMNKVELIDSLKKLPPNTEFIFELDIPVSKNVISEQLKHIPYDFKGMKCHISGQKSPVVLFNDTPLISVLEIFEYLHINWGIISITSENSDQIMTGFIDRYILANLIDSEFEELKDELLGYNDYDVESLLDYRQRISTEIIT